MPLDQDALDALRLTRAREEEAAARAEMADAKREVAQLRGSLHAAERRAQDAARRAERAAGVRRALEQQRVSSTQASSAARSPSQSTCLP